MSSRYGQPEGPAALYEPSAYRPGPTAAVVVPVKAFAKAKMRLSGVLSPQQRAELARNMAANVVGAGRPLPVAVVCDDPEVSDWAQSLGARALVEPGLGLNGAVAAAFALLGQEGYERIVIAHGDLPLAINLSWLADLEGIALVPDRREEGTNVISLPTGCGFRFAYGPGSFARHQQEARRTGLAWRAIHDPRLAWDVDLPIDMAPVAP